MDCRKEGNYTLKKQLQCIERKKTTTTTTHMPVFMGCYGDVKVT